eukprot:8839460-Alexandrium_andersonii.AAC.1
MPPPSDSTRARRWRIGGSGTPLTRSARRMCTTRIGATSLNKLMPPPWVHVHWLRPGPALAPAGGQA